MTPSIEKTSIEKHDVILIPISNDGVIKTTLAELVKEATRGTEMIGAATLYQNRRTKEQLPQSFFPADHTPHIPLA